MWAQCFVFLIITAFINLTSGIDEAIEDQVTRLTKH